LDRHARDEDVTVNTKAALEMLLPSFHEEAEEVPLTLNPNPNPDPKP